MIALVGWAATAALTGLSTSVAACGEPMVRAAQQGRYDDVLAAAERARRTPRNRRARAWAQALVAKGDPATARTVLMTDFRHGSHLRSLEALAELEREQGLWGVAALHYDRLASLDEARLRGQEGPCNLWARRAAALTEAGEFPAAFDDVERLAELCGTRVPKLEARAAEGIRWLLKVRHGELAVDTPRAHRLSGWAGAPSEATVAESLAPGRIVERLVADVDAQDSRDWIDDEALARLIGEQEPGAVAAAAGELDGAHGAYLAFRLARLFPADKDVGHRSADELAQLLDRAGVGDGPIPWRVAAYGEDLSDLEGELTRTWRSQAAPSPDGAGDTSTAVSRVTHWSTRLPARIEAISAALTLARVRRADRDGDLAIGIARGAGRLAVAMGGETGRAAVVDHVVAELGWGRPWSALAVLDALGEPVPVGIRAAAATGVLLEDLLAPDPLDDHDEVERVMGTSWLEQTRASLHTWALAGQWPLAPTAGCPTLAEGLGRITRGGFDGALGHWFERVWARPQQPSGSGAAELAALIEADLTLGCGHELLLPLLANHGGQSQAAALGAMWSQAPTLRAATALEAQAKLAVMAGEGPRAELLAVAAGAEAADPALVWRELAIFAREQGDRDAEVQALRQWLLQVPDFRGGAARRALALHAVLDARLAWGARDTAAGQEASRRRVQTYLETFVPNRVWGAREALAYDLATASWIDEADRHALAALVVPAALRDAHALALARMEGRMPDAGAWAWRPGALALAIELGEVSHWPVAVQVLRHPEDLTLARWALARHSTDLQARQSAALGLALVGPDFARAAAVRELLRMAPDPARRRQIAQLVLASPAALGPRNRGQGGPSVRALVDDGSLLAAALFDLDLGPRMALSDPGPWEALQR